MKKKICLSLMIVFFIFILITQSYATYLSDKGDHKIYVNADQSIQYLPSSFYETGNNMITDGNNIIMMYSTVLFENDDQITYDKSYYEELYSDESIDTAANAFIKGLNGTGYNFTIESKIKDVFTTNKYDAIRVKASGNFGTVDNYHVLMYATIIENTGYYFGIISQNENYFYSDEAMAIMNSYTLSNYNKVTKALEENSSDLSSSTYDYSSAIIDIFLTIFVNGILDLIVINCIHYKSSKKVAAIISISLWILTIIMSGNGAVSTAGYVTWYFINASILEKYRKKDKNSDDDPELENLINNNSTTTKIITCKVCGKEIEDNPYGTCDECYNKIMKRLEEKEKNNFVDEKIGINEDKINTLDEKSLMIDKANIPEEAKIKLLKNKKDLSIENLKSMILNLENQNEKKYCPSCGAEIKDNWKYCKNCGNSLEE